MIYVIRHGKTEGGQKGEVPLNEHGIQQSKEIAPKVAKLGINHIFSSDVKRAMQTTEIINEVTKLGVTYDSRLREFSILTNYPLKSLDNLTQQEIEKYGEGIKESFKDAYNRVNDFLNDLRKNKIDNVAIVTHRGVISTISYCLNNGEFDFERFDKNRKAYKQGTDNCSITVFELYDA